eukprot:TRINITY_DN12272_c0_g1_i2.p1 TRINITY_DN12272_c0_g1~~TRINITY_DN12272_c0_g1_i2.p1  ORF type:complete len:199 (-),score=1.26 TRINITY_DN12272_c0_g1_i2:117-713(-)
MGKNTKDKLTSVLCEFCEVCVQQILYARKLCDPELFKLYNIYGTNVRKCRHPQLVAYIKTAIKSLENMIGEGTLDSLWLVIFNQNQNVVERYQICIQMHYEVGEPFDQERLRGAFAGTIRKLQSTEFSLPALSEDCRFELMITTLQSQVPDKLWMEHVSDTTSFANKRNLLWNVRLDGMVDIQTTVELFNEGRRLEFR